LRRVAARPSFLRILLVQPPLLPAGEVAPPVGLCTLASWLLPLGHEVAVVDLDLEARKLDDPNHQYFDIFARHMRNFSPHMVGLTSMYSNSLQAERLIRHAKTIDPSVATVAGGSHFGALGREALRRIPELDYAIEGEAETAIAGLLAGNPVAEIPRLHYRANGELRQNQSRGLIDLASLPPMWSNLSGCVHLERYAATIAASAPRRIAYVEAGRGCPFACTFCATAPFWEQRFRVKPVDRIVGEIRFLHEEFGYDSFILVHDLPTASSAFISSLCDGMTAARLPVEWMANSRTDIRLKGLLPKMKAAGCWKLFLGIESASTAIQKTIDKKLKLPDAVGAIQELTDHGISATTSFVIGFPAETTQELSATVALGARFKLMGVETVQLHRLRIFPPSPLSRSLSVGEFDLASLQIEYPFLEVPPDDIAAIKEDRDFFAGYWAPSSAAGTAAELAQLEMFFHHMIALAPLTVAAAAQFAGDRLVSSFYGAAAKAGPLHREKLDWESGAVFQNWCELEPLVNVWLSEELSLGAWQMRIVSELRAYENHRIRFVAGQPAIKAFAEGRSWAAFHSQVDFPDTLRRLQSDLPLTADLLRPGAVVLTRKPEGQFAVYTLAPSRIADLTNGSPSLVSLFEGPTQEPATPDAAPSSGRRGLRAGPG
jgi:radical SAM superfamily enzyme YgiQ (UPF0313 family)